MKSVTLNVHAGRDAEKTGRRLNGKRSLTTGVGGTDRVERLLLTAQEMGGPLTVIIGRMEYLLKRGAEKETLRSLNAIMPQTAYELYLARCGAGGDAAGDWLQAEQELQARQQSM